MNTVDELRRDVHRLHRAVRIDSAVAAAKADDLRNTVPVMELEKERANDIVQPRAQTAAGDDAGARLLRVEEQLRARPSQLEADSRIFANLNPLRDANIVTRCVTFCRSE